MAELDIAALTALYPDNVSQSISPADLRSGHTAWHHDQATGHVSDGDYYVCSKHGDDSNAGTSIDAPFLTIQQAADTVAAGDRVYIRGGLYPEKVLFSTTGTEASRIEFFGYPGERPIIDGAPLADQGSIVGLLDLPSGVNWYRFKDITVAQTTYNSTKYITGVQIYSNNHEFYDIYAVGNTGDGGFFTSSVTGLLFVNCRSWYNYEPFNSGESGDGFKISATDVRLVNCLAWRNSDDGFEFRGTNIEARNCHSWENGYIDDGTHPANGDGNGYKFGPTSGTNITLLDCTTHDNQAGGFLSAVPTGRVTLVGCGSWDNATDDFLSQVPSNGTQDFELINCWTDPGGTVSINEPTLQLNCSWGIHTGTATNPTFQDSNNPPAGYPYLETDTNTLKQYLEGAWRTIATY